MTSDFVIPLTSRYNVVPLTILVKLEWRRCCFTSSNFYFGVKSVCFVIARETFFPPRRFAATIENEAESFQLSTIYPPGAPIGL